MNELTIKIKSVTILLTNGQDIISITPDNLPSPYPNLGYEAYIEIKTAHNYAEIYCKEVLGITDYKLINTRSEPPMNYKYE